MASSLIPLTSALAPAVSFNVLRAASVQVARVVVTRAYASRTPVNTQARKPSISHNFSHRRILEEPMPNPPLFRTEPIDFSEFTSKHSGPVTFSCYLEGHFMRELERPSK